MFNKVEREGHRQINDFHNALKTYASVAKKAENTIVLPARSARDGNAHMTVREIAFSQVYGTNVTPTTRKAEYSCRHSLRQKQQRAAHRRGAWIRGRVSDPGMAAEENPPQCGNR